MAQSASHIPKPKTRRPRDYIKINERTRKLLETGADAYIPTSDVVKFYGVRANTLRRWADEGLVRAKRIGNSERAHFLYNAQDLQAQFPEVRVADGGSPAGRKRRIAYARAFDESQRSYVDWQVQQFLRLCPDHEFVTDLSPGHDWQRPGFTAILDGALEGVVGEVAVLHKDILARQAFELVERVLVQSHVRLVVVGQEDEAVRRGLAERFASREEQLEFADEIVHLTRSVVARDHGRRTGANMRATRYRAAVDQATQGQGSEPSEEEGEEPSGGHRHISTRPPSKRQKTQNARERH